MVAAPCWGALGAGFSNWDSWNSSSWRAPQSRSPRLPDSALPGTCGAPEMRPAGPGTPWLLSPSGAPQHHIDAHWSRPPRCPGLPGGPPLSALAPRPARRLGRLDCAPRNVFPGTTPRARRPPCTSARVHTLRGAAPRTFRQHPLSLGRETELQMGPATPVGTCTRVSGEARVSWKGMPFCFVFVFKFLGPQL